MYISLRFTHSLYLLTIEDTLELVQISIQYSLSPANQYQSKHSDNASDNQRQWADKSDY